MVKGTVKWFHSHKGFGFLQEEENGDVYYVDISAISGGEGRPLAEGEKVSFDCVKGPRGWHVTKVMPEGT